MQEATEVNIINSLIEAINFLIQTIKELLNAQKLLLSIIPSIKEILLELAKYGSIFAISIIALMLILKFIKKINKGLTIQALVYFNERIVVSFIDFI